MDLYLQFGYGMMEHCRHLLSEWGGGTAILSPRDLTDQQLSRLSSEITELENGQVLLDPQFYLPHADHKRLCKHDYWPKEYATNAFWHGPALSELLSKLSDLNVTLGTSAFILPGLLASTVNDDWLATQKAIFEEASALGEAKSPLFITIALSSDATRDEDQIALLLEHTEEITVAGYYLVCEHPNGNYLVDDPVWVANVLDLIAGLRLRGARVVLGYCNHQMLIAACAKANAICSGTWMNVRSFPPDKFRSAYDDEIKQRATWYYSPAALSEYKIPFLDIAHRLGVLDSVKPGKEFDNDYVASLFTQVRPSSVGFTEQAAFRHYLHCLRVQCNSATHATFDETIAAHTALLDQAEKLLGSLSSSGIRGQLREFTEIIDVNRAALAVLAKTRAPMLRRRWPML